MCPNFGVRSTTNFISVHWNGSEAALQGVSAPSSKPALTGFVSNSVSGGKGALVGTVYTNTANLIQASPHIAFTDTFSSTSLFHGNNAATGGDTRNYVNPSGTNDIKIAVEAYAFVTSTNWSITNITTAAAKSLWQAPGLPASVISGIPADTNNSVFAVGRNIDSGARVIFLAETGLGTKATISQYTLDSTGTNVYQTPIQTNDGYVDAQPGIGGYSTTANLITAASTYIPAGADISQQVNGTGTDLVTPGAIYLIGYAALNSANGTTPLPNILSYNGVVGSTNTIANGQYTFWSYAHIVKSTIYTTANSGLVFGSLKTYLLGLTTAQLANHGGNVALGDMQVVRVSDGGVLGNNFLIP